MQEEHGLSTVRTGDRMGVQRNRTWGCISRVCRVWNKIWSGRETVAESGQASAQGGGEETIVTDLHEVFGQDMLQETMDELMSPQGTTFFRTGLGVAIAKGHTILFQLEQAVVAEGDAEDVRCQIFQRIQTGAHLFTVHNPILLPNLGWNTGITIGVTQSLLEFAAENPGEHLHRQKEIVA
jgi:hypothetical protein